MTEKRLLAQFLSTLQELVDVHASLNAPESAGVYGDRESDAEVEVEIGGQLLKLLVEVRKSAYPRDVRELLWQIKQIDADRRRGDRNDEVVPLLVAESISPGAKELLRKEHVGYYDTGGSLFLPARGVYLYIDKPPPKPLAKSIRSLFSGRRAQVLHALLVQHQSWFGVTQLAQQAKVSPATASQTLTELERFDWLDSRGKGPTKERRLIEPGALLDAWVNQLASNRPPTLRRYYVPSGGAEKLIDRVAHACEAHDVEYAITHEAAAQRYAQFLSSISQVRCRMLVGSAVEEAIGALEARVVNEGINLVIMEAKSRGDFLFKQRVGDAWLASPIQVYLDLVHGEGRTKELAEHLRHERIGF